MLLRFGETQAMRETNLVGMTVALAPDAVSALDRIVEGAGKLAAEWPRSQEYRLALGATLCRARRWGEAVQRLSEARQLPFFRTDRRLEGGRAYGALFLAMAEHRLGHAEAARRWLEEAVQWIEEALQRKPASGEQAQSEAPESMPLSWELRLELQLLRREAEALIGAGRRRQ
jgi:hypothetical protein